MTMTRLYESFIHATRLRRFVVLASIIVLLFAIRSVLTIILLTFIFTYIGIRLIQGIQKLVKVPPIVIIICLYLLLLAGAYLALITYLPEVYHQSQKLYGMLHRFYQGTGLTENNLIASAQKFFTQTNWLSKVSKNSGHIVHYLGNITSVGTSIVLSFVLSFFYLIEKSQMYRFSRLFLSSDFGWYFQDVQLFAKKFINTFGRVMEAQLIITIINTAITTICLAILGFHSLLSIALMVFLLSLIPVAGVLISCIPLSLIAYTQGGFRDVAYILILISCIHLFESYVLNPKLMAKKTELPIFYTFCVLMASSRLFGLWGLVVGVPIFTFFLDILNVKELPNKEEKQQKKQRED